MTTLYSMDLYVDHNGFVLYETTHPDCEKLVKSYKTPNGRFFKMYNLEKPSLISQSASEIAVSIWTDNPKNMDHLKIILKNKINEMIDIHVQKLTEIKQNISVIQNHTPTHKQTQQYTKRWGGQYRQNGGHTQHRNNMHE